MRRLLILAVLAAGMCLAMRKITVRAGPVMRERCSERCEPELFSAKLGFAPNILRAFALLPDHFLGWWAYCHGDSLEADRP